MRGFRIVIAAHGDLATALLSAAELICGACDDVEAIALLPEDSPESFAERLAAAVGAPDLPLLVLTDLVGGTPHNVALQVVRRRTSAYVISGVNLAVVMEAAMSIDVLDSAAVDRLVELGRRGLVDAGTLLASRSP
jgi:mannose/fructose/sorbose-specific phosphotransferase system IIA component